MVLKQLMKEGIQCVVYLREEVDGTPPIFTAKPPSPSPLSSPRGGSEEGNCISCNNYAAAGEGGGVMEETSEEYFFSGKLHLLTDEAIP